MPLYRMRCTACAHEFEDYRSIKAKTPRKCPECKRPALTNVFGNVYVFDRTPKTIGSLAEQNAQKMGKEQVELKQQEYEAQVNAGKPKVERPWYRPDSDKPIPYKKVDTPEKQRRYIETGQL